MLKVKDNIDFDFICNNFNFDKRYNERTGELSYLLYSEGNTMGTYYEYLRICASTREINAVHENGQNSYYDFRYISNKLFDLIQAELIEKIGE